MSAAGCDRLKIELKNSGEFRPEISVAMRCSIPGVNKWAFAAFGVIASLGISITIVLQIALADASLIIAGPVLILNVMLGAYAYFIVAPRAGIALGGKLHLSKFNEVSCLPVPGTAWIALSESNIFVYGYQISWPSLKLRATSPRDSCTWSIANIETIGDHCFFDLSELTGVEVRLRATSQLDVTNVAERLRSGL